MLNGVSQDLDNKFCKKKLFGIVKNIFELHNEWNAIFYSYCNTV